MASPPIAMQVVILSADFNVTAQLGDLVESLLKRGAGVKDSGASAAGPWRRAGPHRRVAFRGCRSCGSMLHYAYSPDIIRFSSHRMKRIAILGSTGSIGHSTLSIVESYPERFQVATLAAGNNVDDVFEQARRFHPKLISVATEENAAKLRTPFG